MAELKKINAPVSDKERELLKSVFKDNEYLLKIIRSLFFGYDVTQKEKDLIVKTFKNADLKEYFRKKIYPLMSNETPIGQISDFWLGVEEQVLGQSRDTIYQIHASKSEVKRMLEKSIALLTNPDGEKINLEVSSIEADPLQVKMLARNLYIKTMETGLNFIQLTANYEEPSSTEINKKAKLNSNK